MNQGPEKQIFGTICLRVTDERRRPEDGRLQGRFDRIRKRSGVQGSVLESERSKYRPVIIIKNKVCIQYKVHVQYIVHVPISINGVLHPTPYF